MTVDEFRAAALSLAGAEERSHQGHPDFRVNNRIFATAGYPDGGWAMVKLTPAEQRSYIQSHPNVFEPARGAWGVQGSTLVRLRDADADAVREALEAAWRGVQAKRSSKRSARRAT